MVETIQKAKSLGYDAPGITTFEEDLAFHFHSPHGLVFSFEESLLLARPVRLDKLKELEKFVSWPISECSAWFVWLAVGQVNTLMKLMGNLIPELPYILMRHRNKIKMFETRNLEELKTFLERRAT